MVRNRNVEIGVSALLILFGLYVAFGGIGLGYLDAGVPGPGFFPMWSGVGMAVFSAINLVKVLRRHDMLEGIELAEIGRVGLATLALAVFAWLGVAIGMMPAAFLLMLAIGAIFGPRNARFYAALAVICAVMTAVLYFVFAIALAVPLA